MLNINSEIFDQVVADALQAAQDSPRWLSAIGKAVHMLEDNPFVELQADGSLLVMSDTSFNTYEANGACQCIAFTQFQVPCKHRAAHRLIQLYNEMVSARAALSTATGAPVAAQEEGVGGMPSSFERRPSEIRRTVVNGRAVEKVRGIMI
ncbi:MAG TPA: hypothetical protein VGB17_14195 [Pyrinomonadaceae bacterium]